MMKRAGGRIIGQHFAYFLFRETHHLIEIRCERVVGADVESAGQIVHDHGTYTGDEATLDTGVGSCFHLVEEGAQIAFAMCLVGVTMQTLRIGEDGIGKVVVLIDEEINFTVRLLPKRRGRMKKKNLSASSIMGIKRVLST